MATQFLHTMLRIGDIDASLKFYCDLLGFEERTRMEVESGRFTLIFLRAPGDRELSDDTKRPEIELTYNWDPEDYAVEGRAFGHIALRVDDVYAVCEKLREAGVTINRPPRDGHMAFVKSPDGVSVELLQAGEAQPKKEPWASMENVGSW